MRRTAPAHQALERIEAHPPRDADEKEHGGDTGGRREDGRAELPDAEHEEPRRDHPEKERRVVEPHVAREVGRQPIPAFEHLLRLLRVVAIVVVREDALSQATEDDDRRANAQDEPLRSHAGDYRRTRQLRDTSVVVRSCSWADAWFWESLLALPIGLAGAQEPDAPGPIKIARATGPIVVDGDPSEPAWQDAAPVDRWWETNPGDNVEPKVRNVARLVYDDKYLYAAFEFDDPEPKKIRAPYADRDNVPSTTDYGGVIIDPDNDRKTAILFLSNPRGIQYDANTSDTSGEDSAPDWFWDSAGKINDHGWTLEIRIPFSSLRYPKGSPQTWGIMLYRNWPRDRRYQMFTTRLPRGSSCFICNEQTLEGLSDLPPGGNWVVAPYGVARQESVPRAELGSQLVHPAADYDAGVDTKWTPNAGTTVDLTVNPDFSQVESDVAQITANERFALFYPEKRPFFLEGVDLLSTPVNAVYTRTITDPLWGARATGRAGDTSYTALLTHDDGGGTVIIPGPYGSDFAPQDFESTVAIGRVRHDLGQSFVSGLVTDREIRGGGFNRGHRTRLPVAARRRARSLTGQVLYSRHAAFPTASARSPARAIARDPTRPSSGTSTTTSTGTPSPTIATTATSSARTSASFRRWASESSTWRAGGPTIRRRASSRGSASSCSTTTSRIVPAR